MPVTIVRILDAKLTDAYRLDSKRTLCDYWRAQGWVYSDEDAAKIPQILVHIGWRKRSMATSSSSPPVQAAAAAPVPVDTALKEHRALVFPADKLVLATTPPHQSVGVVRNESCDVGDEWDGGASAVTQTQYSGAASAARAAPQQPVFPWQMKNRTKVRDCFVARNGFVFIAADYGQVCAIRFRARALSVAGAKPKQRSHSPRASRHFSRPQHKCELRMIAEFSQDAALCKLLREAHDVFEELARSFRTRNPRCSVCKDLRCKTEHEEVAREERDQAKTVVYSVLYVVPLRFAPARAPPRLR